jgi:hypothetical protein
MPEIRLSMTPEARTVLGDLLRLAAPAAARGAVNRARLPEDDPEMRAAWKAALADSAAAECALLAGALAGAKGNPAVVVLPDDEAAWTMLRALSAVRLTLRETVLAGVPDEALETEHGTTPAAGLTAEEGHALACYDCFGLLQFALLRQLDPAA